MALYIRDADVHALAKRVAEARGTSVTEAVRRALARECANIEGERRWRDGELRRLFAEFDAYPADSDFGDVEMYSENGLPQ